MSAPGAWADFRAKWLDAEPELRLAALFVRALREPSTEALLVLRFELADAALGVRDAGVAQAKLGWWLGEVDALADGHARHPVAIQVAGTCRVDARDLAALVAGAGALARVESPESVDALVDGARPFAEACGRLAGTAGDAALVQARAAGVVAGALRDWPRFASPERARIPLDLLARHGLNRAQLVDAAGADALLAELLQGLDARLAAAPRPTVPHDAAWIAARRVLVAHLLRNVAATRAGRVPPPGPRALFATWRSALR